MKSDDSDPAPHLPAHGGGQGRGFGRTLAISLGGAGVGALAAFAVAGVVSNTLGEVGAGIFFQFVAVFTIALTIVKLGADTGLVRTLAQLRALGGIHELPRVIGFALTPVAAVGSALAVVTVIAAPTLAELLTSGDQVRQAEELIRYLSPLVVIGALMYLVLGAMRGLGAVGSFVAVLNIGLPLGRLALVSAVLAAGASAVGAVLAWAGLIPLWCILAAILLWRMVRQAQHRFSALSLVRQPTQIGVPSASAKSFWTFSLGRWASATVEVILDWADVLLVGALLSPAAAGVYAVATRVIRAGQVVDNAMRVAVGPRISARMALRDLPGVDELFRTASQSMLVLTLPFYVTCFVFSETILSIFGPGFTAGAGALRVLAVGMVVSAATIMSQSIVLMAGRSHWQLQNKTIALAVVVGGNLLLIPHQGIVGAATAWSLGIATDAVLVSRQSSRLVGSGFRARTILIPLGLVGGGVALVGVVVRLLTSAGLWSVGIHLGVVALGYLVGLAIATRVFGFSPKALLRQ